MLGLQSPPGFCPPAQIRRCSFCQQETRKAGICVRGLRVAHAAPRETRPAAEALRRMLKNVLKG
jgi:hypothetical protein